jgi:glutamate--cysteine ligase
LRFLEAFAALCVLKDSPPIGSDEQAALDDNHALVAHRGREPGLWMNRDGREESMASWAAELIDSMRGICELLDAGNAQRPYTAALELQEAKINDVALTPSARTLQELRATGESFADLAMRMSSAHKNYFLELYPPNEQRLAEFSAQAEASLEKQAAIERADDITFDEFLRRYFQNR